MKQIIYTRVVINIMCCVYTAKLSPGMQDSPFLNIILRKKRIKVKIKSTFISICPEYNTGMIYVAGKHFSYQHFAYRSIIGRILPGTEFIYHIKT